MPVTTLRAAPVVRHVTIYGLVILATLLFLFRQTTPEGDLYFVAYSISRFLDTGVFPAHMSYTFELSPLYYFLYGGVMRMLSVDTGHVLPFLNAADWLVAVGLLPIFGLLLRELGVSRERHLFLLALLLMPSYWYVSLYAHPITLATLLFLLSLLLFLRHVRADPGTARNRLWVASLSCYVLSLLLRPDGAFLFALFPAAVVTLGKESTGHIARTALLLVLTPLAYVAARRLMPEAGALVVETGFVGRLMEAADPALWTGSLRTALQSVGVGGVGLFALSTIVLMRARQWRLLLLPMIGIVCVVVAWLGIPIHIRRFYHLGPLLVLLAYAAMLSFESGQHRRRFAGGCLALLLVFNLGVPVTAQWALRRSVTEWEQVLGVLALEGIVDLENPQAATQREVERFFDQPGPGSTQTVLVLGSWGHVGELSYALQRQGRVAADEANVAEIAPPIRLQRLDLRCVVGCDHRLPIPPPSPAIGKGIGPVDVQDAGPLPVSAPPRRRMQAAHARLPPRS